MYLLVFHSPCENARPKLQARVKYVLIFITCVGRKLGAFDYESCVLFSGGSDGEVSALLTVCYS
jgi:hypothetical protein